VLLPRRCAYPDALESALLVRGLDLQRGGDRRDVEEFVVVRTLGLTHLEGSALQGMRYLGGAHTTGVSYGNPVSASEMSLQEADAATGVQERRRRSAV